MDENLLSVGLDIGTTSTQMILSSLRIENRASAFSVPEMQIAERKILYKSPVHFTPLLRGELVDGSAIRNIVTEEYQKAGIGRADVDTGAIIITGETSRKENAAAVLQNLSDLAGDFVVATAGPDLESVLAAKGASDPQRIDTISSPIVDAEGLLIDRKLNVALTRARRRMYIFGNRKALSTSPLYKALMDALEE